MEDKDIIDGIKNGDENCFIYLVNEYKKKVISLCYSYTNDSHEAEDISQEVFINFYKGINKFRGDCSISTYIYRITVSRCIDYKRKKSIKNFLTGLINITKAENEDIDDRNFVRECINKLPGDLKEVIVLYYYTGLSQKEIGDVLELSTKAVEGRIYRARKILKTDLEKGGYCLCNKDIMI